MRLSLRRCEKISELLPWHVNGTLSGEELTKVEHHLRRCQRCCAEVRELRKLQASLAQALEEVHPPAGLLERTGELIAAEARLEEQLLKLLSLGQAERQKPLTRLNLGFLILGFSLGMAYERGRLPFEAELSALGLPLARFKGRI
jgi:anti-sigma factor RsiW